jgi:hypothetical protein
VASGVVKLLLVQFDKAGWCCLVIGFVLIMMMMVVVILFGS